MPEVAVTQVDPSGASRRSRTVDERLMVRFPGAYRALAALVMRALNPGSRPRRALARRHHVSAHAAANRRDFELMVIRYAPDSEVE